MSEARRLRRKIKRMIDKQNNNLIELSKDLKKQNNDFSFPPLSIESRKKINDMLLSHLTNSEINNNETNS